MGPKVAVLVLGSLVGLASLDGCGGRTPLQGSAGDASVPPDAASGFDGPAALDLPSPPPDGPVPPVDLSAPPPDRRPPDRPSPPMDVVDAGRPPPSCLQPPCCHTPAECPVADPYCVPPGAPPPTCGVLGLGCACTASDQCVTNLCQDGTCSYPELPAPPCNLDTDCPAGRICEVPTCSCTSQCVPGCSGDADCGEGEICAGPGSRCEAKTCLGLPYPPSESGCPANFACEQGVDKIDRCVRLSCQADRDCAEGYCVIGQQPPGNPGDPAMGLCYSSLGSCFPPAP
jgi:hypothetical protein